MARETYEEFVDKFKPKKTTVADLRTLSKHKDFTIKREDVKEINRKDYFSIALILDENQAAELLRKEDQHEN